MNLSHARPRPALLATVAAAIVVTAAGCASASTTSPSSTSTSTPSTTSVAAAPATSDGAGSAVVTTAAPAEPHNQADLMFAAMMTPHHEGAIEMADLVPDRASSTAVKSLAAQIKAAQGPEITEMTGWLAAWRAGMASMPMATSAASSAHGMSGMFGMSGMSGISGMSGTDAGSTTAGFGTAMPGMMTDAQMQQLRDAKGQAFDTLFLRLMISHHQGAIAMADIELASGRSPAALALATAIKIGQAAEIVTMQRLLGGK